MNLPTHRVLGVGYVALLAYTHGPVATGYRHALLQEAGRGEDFGEGLTGTRLQGEGVTANRPSRGGGFPLPGPLPQ